MSQQKSAIVRDISQLKEIDIQLKRYRKEIKQLRDAKEQCEKRILEYLDTNDQPGVKYDGITIIAENRRRRKYEKKQNKIERGMEVLTRKGISVSNSQDTLNELLEAMRGEPIEKPSIRFIR